MKKILFATDFSKCANNAMDYALGLARKAKAEIIVLHTILPVDAVDNNVYNMVFVPDYLQGRQEELSKWILRFKRRPENNELGIRGFCELGGLLPVMKDKIEEEGIDLVVMGTTGAGGFKGVLGSHAAMISTAIDIPALFIPDGKTLPDKPKLAIGTDFIVKMDATNYQIFRELMRILGIKTIDVVSAIGKEGEKKRAVAEKNWTDNFPGLNFVFHYIHDNDAVRSLLHFVESTGTHLVSTVAHEHNFIYRWIIASSTERIVKKALVPILVLHG